MNSVIFKVIFAEETFITTIEFISFSHWMVSNLFFDGESDVAIVSKTIARLRKSWKLLCNICECSSFIQFISREVSQATNSLFFMRETQNSKCATWDLFSNFSSFGDGAWDVCACLLYCVRECSFLHLHYRFTEFVIAWHVKKIKGNSMHGERKLSSYTWLQLSLSHNSAFQNFGKHLLLLLSFN